MAPSPPIGANETEVVTQPGDTTVERPTVAIDRAFFPEIFEDIFAYSSKEALFALRRSCRDLFERVNAIFDPYHINLRMYCQDDTSRHVLYIHDTYNYLLFGKHGSPPESWIKVLSLRQERDDYCLDEYNFEGSTMKVEFLTLPQRLTNLEVVRILPNFGGNLFNHLPYFNLEQISEVYAAAPTYIVFTGDDGLRLPKSRNRSSALKTKNLVINIGGWYGHIDDQWLSPDLIWPNLSEVVLFFDSELDTSETDLCVSLLTARPVKNIRYTVVGLEDARQEYGSQDDDDNWKSALLARIRIQLNLAIAAIPQQTKDKWTKAIRKGMDTEKILGRVTVLSKSEYRSKVGKNFYRLVTEEYWTPVE